jgi:hypothetical protein
VCNRETMPSGRELMERDAGISDMFDSKANLPTIASPWLLRHICDTMEEYAVADDKSYAIGWV